MQALDAEGGEARLYCYSEARAKKEQGIANRFAARFEGEMSKLNDGLKRPRTRKRLDHVWQRIGRIREKSRGAAAHYDIDVIADDSGEKARAAGSSSCSTARPSWFRCPVRRRSSGTPSASPRPSGARMAAPCMSARPHGPSPNSRKSFARSEPIPLPEASGK